MHDIEETKVSLKTMAVLILGAISLTATVSSVYHGIVYNSERVEYVNDRIDKKTGRNEEEVILLKNRVSNLESLIIEITGDE